MTQVDPISEPSSKISELLLTLQDLEGYQALPDQLDALVHRALPDQMVKEEEREPRVPLDLRENEAAEDYQDPRDLQAPLVNQHSVKQVLVMDFSWVRFYCVVK